MLERWKEHFTEVLNRPEPETEAEVITEGVEEIEVSIEYLSKEEIGEAIDDLKNNKAAGPDNITAEVLKADKGTTVTKLEEIFKLAWDAEEVPSDW